MKTQFFYYSVVLLSLILVTSCTQKSENPFFTQWNTPFGVPPFDEIKEDHYMDAFKEGMRYHKKEVEIISENPEKATFQNTIEALDKSGALLTKVSEVFYGLQSAHTNDRIQSIAKEVAPLNSQHTDDILLNDKLFQRIKTIYEERKKLNLSPEENMLLEKTYKQFVRGGANLDAENSHNILDAMVRLNQELETTFIFATHDEKVIRYLRRKITIVDGQVAKDEIKPFGKRLERKGENTEASASVK